MPHVNNIAITRQFAGHNRFESEKISVSMELSERDSNPGDLLRDLHCIVSDLNPYGPWSDEEVGLATKVAAESREIATMTPVTAAQILADNDACRARRAAAITRLNAIGAVMENKPKSVPAHIVVPDGMTRL